MTHDVFRLRIVQHLDDWHKLALFGGLDAIGQTDHAGAGEHGPKQREAKPNPAGGELLQVHFLAVKKMHQAVVSLGAQAKDTDIAGNPGLLLCKFGMQQVRIGAPL